MLSYVLRRFAYMLIILWAVSIISFILIQLPPGDFLTSYVASVQQYGLGINEEEIAALRKRYNLDQPIYMQYLKWISLFLRGDMGQSLEWSMPVERIITKYLPFTLLLSLLSFALTYALAIPIGVYSAVRQYSIGDYVITIFGFIGLAIPNFLLALVLMFFFWTSLGVDVGGLFSPEYIDTAWSWGRFIDMLKHLPIPIIVVGTAGTAEVIRVLRSCLLDELNKQYVVTARAKGVEERRLLFKYPVRVAINPIVSTMAWILPRIISSGTITAIVLSLPTLGPVLFRALMAQDMHLAGGIIMILSFLTVVGVFFSDILLSFLDPRIRHQGKM